MTLREYQGQPPNPIPMLLCLSRPSFLHSGNRRDRGFAECGHDRDGPLVVEGRLLSGHEVSRLERVPGAAGRSIEGQHGGAAAESRARPPPGKLRDLAVGGGDRRGDQGDGAGAGLPRTARRQTGMAGSPRLAAIRRMACSEEAQGSSPLSRACRAASQLMAASGWPVLMLVPAVMVRRKAWRCRKWPWLMISPAAAASAGIRQPRVPGRGGRELLDAQQPAKPIQRGRDVQIGVGVHATGDDACVYLRLSLPSPFLRLRDGTHPLAVGPVNPGLCQDRADQTGSAGRCQELGPGRQADRRTTSTASARSQVRPGPRLRRHAPTTTKPRK